jgi:hypothetical protein
MVHSIKGYHEKPPRIYSVSQFIAKGNPKDAFPLNFRAGRPNNDDLRGVLL